MIVQFDQDAQAELTSASDYYEERRAGYGLKFITAAELAISRATQTPDAGSLWPDAPSDLAIRRRRVPGFPRVWIAYASLPDRLYILAVVHERRRPGYWLYRLGRVPQP